MTGRVSALVLAVALAFLLLPAAAQALCGDGVVDAGEQCDDTNLVDGDGCDSNCSFTVCGNGIVTSGEGCDDGNTTGGDGCSAFCTVEQCGNGSVDVGEQCDDGNLVDADGCDSNCTYTTCGNGILTAPEACDDGNQTGGDGCSGFCGVEACGNGVPDVGEACDPATGTTGDPSRAAASSAACDDDCSVVECGDGKVNLPAGESCEGSPVGTDTAICDGDPGGVPTAQNCTGAACGDARLNLANGELCDDGNGASGDGCDLNCTPTGCGNGVVTAGEGCDDGNTEDRDACDNACMPTGCGDGVLDAGEGCDDGNNAPFDGCSPTCDAEPCGNGVLEAGEECDPGGGLPTASCDTACQLIDCGNGRVETTEACDPGTGVGGAPNTTAAAESPTCNLDCTPAVCGDLQVNAAAGETCDDGAGGSCDDVHCVATACGDGFVNSTEQCDPGTGTTGDPLAAAADGAVCDADCTDAVCGDGSTNTAAGEQCDPIDNQEGGCGAGCQTLLCGDGVAVAPEVCDDGNLTNGDGCDANCTPTGCGNGILNAGEGCDDGDLLDGDDCDSNCQPTGCGNGVVTFGEECDDGNTADLDGCDALCRDEICGNGILGSSPNGNGATVPEQCDDANVVSSDGCLVGCVLDGDADGLVGADDACTPVSYSQPASVPADQNPRRPRLTLAGLVTPGGHDVFVKGRFNPARPQVCEDNLTGCSEDADCAGIGGATCGPPTPHLSGVHLRITQGTPPFHQVLYEASVPGGWDAPGGEYLKDSPSPACGSPRDGWKVVQLGKGGVVYLYRNRSGVVPNDSPPDTVEGQCSGDARGLKLVRLLYRPKQGEWKYILRVKDDQLDALPQASGFTAGGPIQVQVSLGAAGGYTAAGVQGAAGQCADAQYRGPGPGGVGAAAGCIAIIDGGQLYRVGCR